MRPIVGGAGAAPAPKQLGGAAANASAGGAAGASPAAGEVRRLIVGTGRQLAGGGIADAPAA